MGPLLTKLRYGQVAQHNQGELRLVEAVVEAAVYQRSV